MNMSRGDVALMGRVTAEVGPLIGALAGAFVERSRVGKIPRVVSKGETAAVVPWTGALAVGVELEERDIMPFFDLDIVTFPLAGAATLICPVPGALTGVLI